MCREAIFSRLGPINSELAELKVNFIVSVQTLNDFHQLSASPIATWTQTVHVALNCLRPELWTFSCDRLKCFCLLRMILAAISICSLLIVGFALRAI
jgi:hypothetical protein